MSRFDPYALPHKGLRFALGRLIAATGNVDPADEIGVRLAVDIARSTFGFLRAHARIEDEIFYPDLETRRPGSTRTATDEHHVLEPQVEKLAALTETVAAGPVPERFFLLSELYAGVARFAGSYLLHLDMEEQTIRPAFWDAYADDELLALMGRAMAAMNPEDQQAALPFILPALNVHERVGWLLGVRAKMPPPVFDGLLALGEKVLSPGEYKATVAGLG